MQTLSLSRSARWKMLEDRVPPVEVGEAVFNNGNNSAIGSVKSSSPPNPVSSLRTRKRYVPRAIHYLFSPPSDFRLRLGAFFFLVLLTDDTYLRAVDVSMHVRTLIPNGYSRNAQSRGDSLFDISSLSSPPPRIFPP